MTGEALGAAVLGLLTLIAAVFATVGFLRDVGAGVLVSALAGTGQGVLVLGGAVLALSLALRLRTRARYRQMTVRVQPGHHGPMSTARHEDGHLRAGKAFRAAGVRTGAATIHRDGSGVTQVWIPRDADPNIDVAISAAGRIAAGSSAGCGGSFWPDRGSDNWHIARAVGRGADRSTGERMARQVLARTRSRARELYRAGEIR